MKKHVYINAPITITFVVLCTIVTIIGMSNGDLLMQFFATYPSSPLNPMLYIRLFTHIFGHVDFNHLVSNMSYILLLGPILEEKYHDRLIVIIVVVALVTGVIHNIIATDALLGASSVVFAFILLSSITGKQKGIPLTLILITILYIGNEIITGLTRADTISHLTHIIGGISGATMGLLFKDKENQ